MARSPASSPPARARTRSPWCCARRTARARSTSRCWPHSGSRPRSKRVFRSRARRSAEACSRCCEPASARGRPTTSSLSCARPVGRGRTRPTGSSERSAAGGCAAPTTRSRRGADASCSSFATCGTQPTRASCCERSPDLARMLAEYPYERTRASAGARAPARAARGGNRGERARGAGGGPRHRGGPGEALACLEALDVALWRGPSDGHVRVTSPYRIRARRARHLFVASLQEGEFPRHDPGEPLLSDEGRAELGLAAPRGAGRRGALPVLRLPLATRRAPPPLLAQLRRRGRRRLTVPVARRRPRPAFSSASPVRRDRPAGLRGPAPHARRGHRRAGRRPEPGRARPRPAPPGSGATASRSRRISTSRRRSASRCSAASRWPRSARARSRARSRCPR